MGIIRDPFNVTPDRYRLFVLTKPRRLHLATAAARVHETHNQAREKGKGSPYFFLVGAGVSVPSVPLAWEIERECKARAESLGLASGKPPSDPQGGYSYWLEQAHPDRDARRSYFRDKIEGKPISDANLRLAHLLADGAVTNAVVTSNFDDFISRGLHLFGQSHIVCDHPATTVRLDLDAKDIQIVHVHGSYWFYDLVNTDEEINERAQGGRGPGMSELLGDLLRTRVPLVIGYSGWEGDVIMTALRDRLKKPLRHRLHWFCFRAEGIATLPRWLTHHPDVTFVVPEEDDVLPADHVFDELLRTFGVKAPWLTRDPLGFFAHRLRRELPQAKNTTPDLYYFDDVVRRLDRARRSALPDEGDTRDPIERVRDAVRRSRYVLAAQRANRVALKTLRGKRAEELLDALWPAVSRSGQKPVNDLRVYDAYLRVASGSKQGPRGRLANVLISRAAALCTLENPRKAIAAIDDAEALLRKHPMPRAKLRLQRLRARALRQDRRTVAAVETLRAVLGEPDPPRDERTRRELLGARRELCELLHELGQTEEALRELAALIRRLDRTRSEGSRRELALSLTTRAQLRRALGDEERADDDETRAAEVWDTLRR